MSLQITEINAENGEVVNREMTSEEAKSYEKLQNKLNSEVAAEKAEMELRQAARQSALEKLAALGLTEAEIQALAG